MKKIISVISLLAVVLSFVGCVDKGATYTDTSYCNHSWEYATCSAPTTCTICGETLGEPVDHSYDLKGKCSYCDGLDPEVKKILDKCSLEIPSVPVSVSHYNKSGTILKKYEITNVKYEFEPYGEDVKLNVYISGKKTYDSLGSERTGYLGIEFKLYDEEGYVVYDHSINGVVVSEGESFKDITDGAFTLLSVKPGKYRLALIDSHYIVD